MKIKIANKSRWVWSTLWISMLLTACSGSPPKTLGLDEHDTLRPCPDSPNCEWVTVGHPYGQAEATARLVQAITATDGVVTTQQNLPDGRAYIHAEYTSFLMRFVDDVEGIVSENDLVIRSASRLVHSDFGVNQARVERMFKSFNGMEE